MAKMTFKELKTRADDIFQRYDENFAGKPRATRSLELLDGLIGELESLVEEARAGLNGGRDPAMISMLETARENLEVYQKEREAIAQAKAEGPTTAEGTELARRANLTFGRYHRHFAGEDRRTRDLGLLLELIEELDETLKAMKAEEAAGRDMGPNPEIVERNLAMYRREFTAIQEAQASGTRQEQADTLATLANGQFRLYREHFAGKGRHTRRRELLERMVGELQRILGAMNELERQGLDSESNLRNIGIVEENLKVYATELKEIDKAKASVTASQLAGSLGAAANEIMAEYREGFAGKSRSTRSLEKLSLLADQILEVGLQMRALDEEDPSEVNTKNLGIVLDAWALYESEYRRIEEAQGQ